MAAQSHTGDSPPSQDSSISTGEVIAALKQARHAQTTALLTSVGDDSLQIRTGLDDTIALVAQIESGRDSKGFNDAFKRDLCSIPDTVPRWIPSAVSKYCGTKVDVKQALVATASRNAVHLWRHLNILN